MRILKDDKKYAAVMLYIRDQMSTYKIADVLGISKSSAYDYICTWYETRFGVGIEELEYVLDLLKKERDGK